MKVNFRKDGKITVHTTDLEEVEIGCRTPGLPQVGETGCLGIADDVTGRLGYVGFHLYDDEDGIPGNSRPYIHRLHGWRGTACDIAIYAHGWRSLEEIRPRRGGGSIFVFGKDQKPEEE